MPSGTRGAPYTCFYYTTRKVICQMIFTQNLSRLLQFRKIYAIIDV